MSEPAPVPADQEEALREEGLAPNGMTLVENYDLVGKFADANDVLLITVAQLRAERDQLASELREAREALKPFADIATDMEAKHAGFDSDDARLVPWHHTQALVMKHLRAARAALSDPRPSPAKGDDHG